MYEATFELSTQFSTKGYRPAVIACEDGRKVYIAATIYPTIVEAIKHSRRYVTYLEYDRRYFGGRPLDDKEMETFRNLVREFVR